ncbi:CBS domain-containing protein [Cyanothece sp. BG0011]|uniref:CBS domain-containing protein n=1 Tax=Cyanothece sp. BG0011 TaxID=2082950 RepID=UPI000D1D64A9|nr:CBS domain-containing protein [Cyanothece sp. BG0011]
MMKVADIMTKDVITIRSSAKVSVAVQLMREQTIHTLIVERSHPQDAYGIITDSDIVNQVVASGKNPQQVRVYEIMTKPCLVLNPDLGVEYAAKLFKNSDIRCAPVIKGELLGIVSVSDILNKSEFVNNPLEDQLHKQIEEKINEAKKICQKFSHDSKACQEAWLLVEELEAEASFYSNKKPEKTALEAYLEEYPSVGQILTLDNWCSG